MEFGIALSGGKQHLICAGFKGGSVLHGGSAQRGRQRRLPKCGLGVQENSGQVHEHARKIPQHCQQSRILPLHHIRGAAGMSSNAARTRNRDRRQGLAWTRANADDVGAEIGEMKDNQEIRTILRHHGQVMRADVETPSVSNRASLDILSIRSRKRETVSGSPVSTVVRFQRRVQSLISGILARSSSSERRPMSYPSTFRTERAQGSSPLRCQFLGTTVL